MEVTVGGVAVANGSTLSTTGEMQVTCNAPYVLSVDGVEWVPTASAGGVDSYLLSTGGVVRIFINGTRYFIFKNVIVPDFAINDVYFAQYVNDTRVAEASLDSYYQGSLEEGVTSVSFAVNVTRIIPSMSREDFLNLGATCVQGDVNMVAASWDANYVDISVTNFDPTAYNAIFIGNVLLAFFEPTE